MAFSITTYKQFAARAGKGDPKAIETLLRDLGAAIENLSPAELAFLDGITAGTGLASKALVLDSSGNVIMPATGIFGLSRAALAATGSGASTAAVIATQVVAVTASDGTKAVALPAAAVATGPILVINTVTTATLPVYPVSGGNDNINAGAEDAAFTIGAGKAAWFIPTSATQWYAEDAAAATATTTEMNVLAGATVANATGLKAAIINTDGQLNVPKAQIGQSATGLVGLFGATPVTQPSGAAQALVTFSIGWLTAVTNTSGVVTIGFDTTAHAIAMFDLVAELRAAATLIGAIKGAA